MEVVNTVRKDLAMSLRDLLQHGLVEVSSLWFDWSSFIMLIALLLISFIMSIATHFRRAPLAYYLTERFNRPRSSEVERRPILNFRIFIRTTFRMFSRQSSHVVSSWSPLRVWSRSVVCRLGKTTTATNNQKACCMPGSSSSSTTRSRSAEIIFCLQLFHDLYLIIYG